MEQNQHSEEKDLKESAGTVMDVRIQQPKSGGPTLDGVTTPSRESGRSGKAGWVSAVIVLLLIGAGLGFAVWHDHHSVNNSSTNFNENTNVNTSEYQAVFLSNGQVYFGKLADLNHKYVTLHDIYYLQVQQNLQAGSGGNTSDGSKISLAKLGSELHGPEDKMYVSSDQVLFWENLKDSSQVVQAIHKYQGQ